MDNDLKWNSHVDYIIKKACKKLHSLRVLHRARVCQPNMLRIYLGSVRQFWSMQYRSGRIFLPICPKPQSECKKRALNIIYPEAESYAHALQLGKLDRLDDRRVHLCYTYMARMKSPTHPLHHLLPSPLLDVPNYPLRQKTQKYYLSGTCRPAGQREQRTFFTCKYFM